MISAGKASLKSSATQGCATRDGLVFVDLSHVRQNNCSAARIISYHVLIGTSKTQVLDHLSTRRVAQILAAAAAGCTLPLKLIAEAPVRSCSAPSPSGAWSWLPRATVSVRCGRQAAQWMKLVHGLADGIGKCCGVHCCPRCVPSVSGAVIMFFILTDWCHITSKAALLSSIVCQHRQRPLKRSTILKTPNWQRTTSVKHPDFPARHSNSGCLQMSLLHGFSTTAVPPKPSWSVVGRPCW